jgi:spore coat-associated protein N
VRARATALASAALSVFTIVAAARPQDPKAQAAAVQASGDVQVANSRNGSAILSGALGPGDSLTGTVTISNIGSAPGNFTLGLSGLTDTPGPAGGFFSRELDLSVVDVSVPAAPVAVFSGRLNSLNPTDLGSFAPGAAHTYRFVVSWAAGASDVTMYGSSMTVQFNWSAGDASSAPLPAPPGASTPPSSAAPPSIAPPRLSVRTAGTQQVLRRGGVRASAGCAQACTIVATGYVTVPGAARTYKLVPARRSLKAAEKATFQLRLPRTARKPLRSALRARRKVFAPVVIAATGSAGKGTRVQRKIRVSG